MSGTAFIARLADAVAAKLPDDVTVTADGSDLLIIERGDARITVWAPTGDRRRLVTSADVRDTLDMAARRLARDIPHYRPVFVAPARELVDILRAAG